MDIKGVCSNPTFQRAIGGTGAALATLTVALGVIALIGTMYSGVPVIGQVGSLLGRVGAFAALGAGGGVLIGSLALLVVGCKRDRHPDAAEAAAAHAVAWDAAHGAADSRGRFE